MDKKKEPKTLIRISDDVISEVAKEAASMCYGVTGVATKKSDGLSSLLSTGKDFKGVIVRNKGKDGIEVDIYVILAYGLKVTEVISAIQNQVAFALKQKLSLPLLKVNVFVEDIKEV